MRKIYHEDDATIEILENKTVSILGYGNQGRSWALNLRDSGIDVIVGNSEDEYAPLCREDRFEYVSIEKASELGDIIMVLLPDEVTPEIYSNEINFEFSTEIDVLSKILPKEAYEDIDIALPLGESLEDVVARVESTLNEIIELSENKNVLVVAHGNSIRAMLKTIENISDDSIVEVNIPTGIPLAFNINNDKITKIGYLGDQETIEELEKEIEQQSKIEKDN